MEKFILETKKLNEDKNVWNYHTIEINKLMMSRNYVGKQ